MRVILGNRELISYVDDPDPVPPDVLDIELLLELDEVSHRLEVDLNRADRHDRVKTLLERVSLL